MHSIGTLRDMGFRPCSPPIRSSDFKALADPFKYFLTRSLGIIPALRWSKALSRGSWFAERMLYMNHADPYTPLATKFASRLEEISAICGEMGITGDARHTLLLREKKDYACALGWYEAAAKDIPFRRNLTYEEYFQQDEWQHLGSELFIKVKEEIFDHPLVGQLDHLYLNTRTNTLWIVDDKTTGYSASERAKICPLEYQPQLYIFMLEFLLGNGYLQKKFQLPPGVAIGGMIHAIFQKPSIEFGAKDRPFVWASDGKRKKRKGYLKDHHRCVVVMDTETGEEIHNMRYGTYATAKQKLHELTGKTPIKVYEGEPDLDIYIDRCAHWYKGTGTYEHLEETWALAPPLVYSYLSYDWFKSRRNVFEIRTKALVALAKNCLSLSPYDFLQGGDLMSLTGRISPYAPFYVTPIRGWPNIMLQDNLIVKHRDETRLEEVPDNSITETLHGTN